MNPDAAVDDAGAVGFDLLRKRRRGGAGFGEVLIAVPGAGDAAVDDLALAERAVLMAAEVGDGGDLAVVAEDGDAFAAERHDAGAFFGDAPGGAGIEKAIGDGVALVAIEGALFACGEEVERGDGGEAESEYGGKDGVAFRLERAEADVRQDEGVSHVDAHVERFPNRGREGVEPEVVAGGGHEKEDEEREESELLKGEVGEAIDALIGGEQADQRVGVAAGMELDEGEEAMGKGYPEHEDAEVTAVVEQRQEPRVEAAEGTDGEDDVEHQKGECAESANEKSLRRGGGMEEGAGAGEGRQIQDDTRGEGEIVDPLLTIPGDGLVGEAHGR